MKNSTLEDIQKQIEEKTARRDALGNEHAEVSEHLARLSAEPVIETPPETIPPPLDLNALDASFPTEMPTIDVEDKKLNLNEDRVQKLEESVQPIVDAALVVDKLAMGNKISYQGKIYTVSEIPSGDTKIYRITGEQGIVYKMGAEQLKNSFRNKEATLASVETGQPTTEAVPTSEAWTDEDEKELAEIERQLAELDSLGK